VNVDLVQIEQVLLNLVRNALDALEDEPTDERRLAIFTRVRGTDALVGVVDNGPGIESERLTHLFDPFYTTKESGMGMGLAISQTIIDDHSGDIRAESEPGTGTVFRVRLPLAEQQAEPTRASPTTSSRRWRRGWADEPVRRQSSSSTTTRPCAARCNG
jgi:two-component system sensor kinase FixL